RFAYDLGMRRVIALIAITLFCLTAGYGEEAAAPPTSQRAFDILSRDYAPYCTPDDDLAFPMKVLALSANQYQFWRGSRDLYFTWCKDPEHGGDWLADKGSYVVNHGDLHLGNIGRYAKNGAC